MTTAIFIYRDNCKACKEVKKNHIDTIRELFAKEGVTIEEFNLSNRDFPSFLRITTFYPTTLLMPTEIYKNANSLNLSKIYSQTAVLNGTILKSDKGNGYKISAPRKDYDFGNPKEYIKFYKYYLKNGPGNDIFEDETDEIPVAEVESIILDDTINEKRCNVRIKPLGSK